MPRLREVRRDQVDKDLLPLYDALFGPDRDPVEEPGTATGTPGNWWTVFALVPDCMKHAVDGFKFYRGRNRFISADCESWVKQGLVVLVGASLSFLSTVKR